MSDGSFELQAAIFSALNGLTPALAAGGVHAPAEQDTPLPYVEIGEASSVAADVLGRQGSADLVSIHVWAISQPPTESGLDGGYATVKKIISRIRDALHSKKLTVSGRSYASAIVTSTRVFNDLDGTSVHGVVSLTVNHFGPEES